MAPLLCALICLPFLGSIACLSGRCRKMTPSAVLRLSAVLSALLAGAIFWKFDAAHPYTARYVQLDALSCWLLLIVATLFLAGAWLLTACKGRQDGGADCRSNKFSAALLQLFATIMFCAAAVSHLGLMWLTLALGVMLAALPVAFSSAGKAREAAWQYILLAGVGICLVFAGLVLLYQAQVNALGPDHPFNWPYLQRCASMLSPALIRMAFIFIIIGYGTLLFLVPMYAWQADYPGSLTPGVAMFPGALTSCTVYILLRHLLLLAPGAGRAFISVILLFLALAAAATAFLCLLKRTIRSLISAPSLLSISFMLAALASFSSAPLQALLIHLYAYALLNCALIHLQEMVAQAYRSCEAEQLQGLRRLSPQMAACLSISFCAVVGVALLGSGLSGLHLLSTAAQAGSTLPGKIWAVLAPCATLACILRLAGLLRGEPPYIRLRACTGNYFIAALLLLLGCAAGGFAGHLAWLTAFLQNAIVIVGG